MKLNKSYISALGMLCLLIALGCNTNPKKKLVIYSPHGKDMLKEFEKLYEAKHPDVDIQWLDMGSQEVFDRVSTESKNPQADIWWGAPATMFMRAEKLGLLEPYKPTWAASMPASAKSTGDAWYGTFSTPEVIAYNEKTTKAADVPQDWNDIVKPQYKGKIVLRNPLASGTLRAIFSAILQQSVAKTGKEDQGWQWLKNLNANTSTYAADPTQMYTKLASEAGAITLWDMPDIILQKKKYNMPFGYVFPKSGTVVLTDGIAILKGTKNAALAKDFYEFVTSKQSLLIQADKYYRVPSRADISKAEMPEWLRNSNYQAMDTDWQVVADKEAAWMDKWDSEVKSSQ